MSDALRELGGFLGEKRPDAVLSSEVAHGELTVAVPLSQL